MRTPLVEKQVPEQARELGISEADVVKTVMLKETVDGEFTTVQDVAEAALFLATFPSNALTGQSMIVTTDGSCSSGFGDAVPRLIAPDRRLHPGSVSLPAKPFCIAQLQLSY